MAMKFSTNVDVKLEQKSSKPDKKSSFPIDLLILPSLSDAEMGNSRANKSLNGSYICSNVLQP